jgi:CHAD domain-containing protein
MWKVPDIDPESDFLSNAHRILRVRVSEVYYRAEALRDPEDSVGHHDLRISLKRLRYTLEFFAICYDPIEVGLILSALSTLQDLLGDLHDAEVFIPQLQGALAESGADSPRPGIEGILERMHRQRKESYAAAVALWNRLQEEGFHDRLRRLYEVEEPPAPAPEETGPEEAPA